MRRLLTVVLVSVAIVAVVVPYFATASQVPVPMFKKLAPGTHVVQYAGQSLRFITPVAISVRFTPLSDITTFKLTVAIYPTQSPPPAAASQLDLQIHWLDWGSIVYTGSVPGTSEPFTGILWTESGFTEK